MRRLSKNNNIALEKVLDFCRGDVVYLRGDLVLNSGTGIILHIEKDTCDIHDLKDNGAKELNFDTSLRVPMILVYWFKTGTKMWMEDRDILPIGKGLS